MLKLHTQSSLLQFTSNNKHLLLYKFEQIVFYRVREIMIEMQVKPWLRVPILSDFTSIGKDRRRALKFLTGFADKLCEFKPLFFVFNKCISSSGNQ